MALRYIVFTSLLLALIGKGACQCSTTLSQTTSLYTFYTLTSPSYPAIYPANSNCAWSITGSSGTSRHLFHISDFYIERNYDFLSIYSGTSIFSSQYDVAPLAVVTSQSSASASFTTDYSVQYGGFNIDYIEVDSTKRTCTTTLTATSTKQHAWYTYSSGCTYTINAASNSNIVKIKVMNVLGGSITFSDTGTTNTAISVAGDSEYVSSTATAYVYAPAYVTSIMFTYEEVASGVTNNLATTTVVNYGYNMCTYTSTSAFSTSSYMSTPNYPGYYTEGVNCVSTITASASGNSVMLKFEDLALFYDDFLHIYDGPTTSYNLLGSAWSQGQTVNSTGRSITLNFVTGYYGSSRGFQISYTQIASSVPSCGSGYTTYTADTTVRTITQGPYSNYEEVYWLIIKPSVSDNLVIDVSDMSVEEASLCQYDSITFYDGACNTDTILDRVCGYQPVTYEDSTGVYVLVKFKTDGSITKNGFTLNYYIGNYVSAEASTDDDDDDDNTKYYIIAIVCVFVLAVLIAAIAFFVYLQKMKRQRTAIASGTMTAPKPKVTQMTTHQLLTNLTKKAEEGNSKQQNKPKVQRKTYLHPEPAPSGPNTKVITRQGIPVHPIPSAPPVIPFGNPVNPGPQPPPPGPSNNPVYPPPLYGGGANTVPFNSPAFPPGYDPSQYLKPVTIPPGEIPPNFVYFSPGDARNLGLHQ